MLDFLRITVWFTLSTKLRMSILETQKLMRKIDNSFNNNQHVLNDYSIEIVDSYLYYKEAKKYIELPKDKKEC
ncbi:MAG: hypothetical protein Wins2KO_04260 [Winogradskyella sp.]